MDVGPLDPGAREGIRGGAYACDITFGTASEFGFDYLRDNMKTRLEDQVQGHLDYAIIDEVDSVLIDEARTPLIISGPARDDVTRYGRANRVAEEMTRRQLRWDRQVKSTIKKFDGETHKLAKLEDAMTVIAAGQRDVTFDESNNLIDISSKDTGRIEEVLVGRLTQTVTLDMLFINGDAGYLALKDASRNGTSITNRRRFQGADIEDAPAFV